MEMAGKGFPPYFRVLNSRRWLRPNKIALGSGGRGKILRWTLGRCYEDVACWQMSNGSIKKVVSQKKRSKALRSSNLVWMSSRARTFAPLLFIRLIQIVRNHSNREALVNSQFSSSQQGMRRVRQTVEETERVRRQEIQSICGTTKKGGIQTKVIGMSHSLRRNQFRSGSGKVIVRKRKLVQELTQ